MTISPLLNAQLLWKSREHFRNNQTDTKTQHRFDTADTIRYLVYSVYRPPPWYRRADSWNNRGEITRKGREQRATHAVIVLARPCVNKGKKNELAPSLQESDTGSMKKPTSKEQYKEGTSLASQLPSSTSV